MFVDADDRDKMWLEGYSSILSHKSLVSNI